MKYLKLLIFIIGGIATFFIAIVIGIIANEAFPYFGMLLFWSPILIIYYFSQFKFSSTSSTINNPALSTKSVPLSQLYSNEIKYHKEIEVVEDGKLVTKLAAPLEITPRELALQSNGILNIIDAEILLKMREDHMLKQLVLDISFPEGRMDIHVI